MLSYRNWLLSRFLSRPVWLVIGFIAGISSFAAERVAIPDEVVGEWDAPSCDSICSARDDDVLPRHFLGVVGQPLFGGDERVVVAASYYYSIKPWVGVGGSAGVMDSRYGVSKGDSVKVIKPYIEPAVMLRLPHVWRISGFMAVIPMFQAGVSFIPSYNIRKECGNGLEAYSTSPFGVNLRAGFLVGLGAVPLQIGYVFSTVDGNRKWNSGSGKWKKRGAHGAFIGLWFAF